MGVGVRLVDRRYVIYLCVIPWLAMFQYCAMILNISKIL